jgi:CarD family transcriptional regulator
MVRVAVFVVLNARFGMKAPAGSVIVEPAAKSSPTARPGRTAGKAAETAVDPVLVPTKSIKAARKPAETAQTVKSIPIKAVATIQELPEPVPTTPAAIPTAPAQASASPQPAGKPAAKPAEPALPAAEMNQDVKTNAKIAETPEPAAVVAETASAPVGTPASPASPNPATGQSTHGARGPIHMLNGRPAPISRASNKDESFSQGDFVVYPTHGVGKVERIATEDIAGHKLELIHITFEENRMTLRVPVSKARSAGLRRLATRKMFDEALAVLKGRARIKRTMWSRRAQEYEAKINSGDPIAIAEVVRDLHRNAGQPDQSFSERQIYEAAMDRLAAELAALDLTDKATASAKLASFLKTV